MRLSACVSVTVCGRIYEYLCEMHVCECDSVRVGVVNVWMYIYGTVCV